MNKLFKKFLIAVGGLTILAVIGIAVTLYVLVYVVEEDVGDAKTQNALGVRYEQGQGVTKDLEKAADWYRLAAQQGLAAAQYNLGRLIEEGSGVAQDPERAIEWYRKAAAQEHAEAQHNLGALYDQGRGVPQDVDKAVDWYRKAASNGYAGSKVLRRPAEAQ